MKFFLKMVCLPNLVAKTKSRFIFLKKRDFLRVHSISTWDLSARSHDDFSNRNQHREDD